MFIPTKSDGSEPEPQVEPVELEPQPQAAFNPPFSPQQAISFSPVPVPTAVNAKSTLDSKPSKFVVQLQNDNGDNFQYMGIDKFLWLYWCSRCIDTYKATEYFRPPLPTIVDTSFRYVPWLLRASTNTNENFFQSPDANFVSENRTPTQFAFDSIEKYLNELTPDSNCFDICIEVKKTENTLKNLHNGDKTPTFEADLQETHYNLMVVGLPIVYVTTETYTPLVSSEQQRQFKINVGQAIKNVVEHFNLNKSKDWIKSVTTWQFELCIAFFKQKFGTTELQPSKRAQLELTQNQDMLKMAKRAIRIKNEDSDFFKSGKMIIDDIVCEVFQTNNFSNALSLCAIRWSYMAWPFNLPQDNFDLKFDLGKPNDVFSHFCCYNRVTFDLMCANGLVLVEPSSSHNLLHCEFTAQRVDKAIGDAVSKQYAHQRVPVLSHRAYYDWLRQISPVGCTEGGTVTIQHFVAMVQSDPVIFAQFIANCAATLIVMIANSDNFFKKGSLKLEDEAQQTTIVKLSRTMTGPVLIINTLQSFTVTYTSGKDVRIQKVSGRSIPVFNRDLKTPIVSYLMCIEELEKSLSRSGADDKRCAAAQTLVWNVVEDIVTTRDIVDVDMLIHQKLSTISNVNNDGEPRKSTDVSMAQKNSIMPTGWAGVCMTAAWAFHFANARCAGFHKSARNLGLGIFTQMAADNSDPWCSPPFASAGTHVKKTQFEKLKSELKTTQIIRSYDVCQVTDSAVLQALKNEKYTIDKTLVFVCTVIAMKTNRPNMISNLPAAVSHTLPVAWIPCVFVAQRSFFDRLLLKWQAKPNRREGRGFPFINMRLKCVQAVYSLSESDDSNNQKNKIDNKLRHKNWLTQMSPQSFATLTNNSWPCAAVLHSHQDEEISTYFDGVSNLCVVFDVNCGLSEQYRSGETETPPSSLLCTLVRARQFADSCGATRAHFGDQFKGTLISGIEQTGIWSVEQIQQEQSEETEQNEQTEQNVTLTTLVETRYHVAIVTPPIQDTINTVKLQNEQNVKKLQVTAKKLQKCKDQYFWDKENPKVKSDVGKDSSWFTAAQVAKKIKETTKNNPELVLAVDVNMLVQMWSLYPTINIPPLYPTSNEENEEINITTEVYNFVALLKFVTGATAVWFA